MTTYTPSCEQMRQRTPADDELTYKTTPKACFVSILKSYSNSPLRPCEHPNTYQYDPLYVLLEYGRLFPFIWAKLDRCVDQAQVNKKVRKKGRKFSYARWVDETVHELPCHVGTSSNNQTKT